MFDIDISNPMVQGMIQEQEDKADECPQCGSKLFYDKKTKELKCNNCSYSVKVRIRK